MRQVAVLIFCIILLCSCGVPGNVSRKASISPATSNAVLANIRIERWGEMQFSGILALKERQQEMTYVLLDATGVKLLEGEVDAAADQDMLDAKGPLRESHLPRFLSTSLARMFLLEPEKTPCSWYMIFRFCREMADATVSTTSFRAGPLLVWEVDETRKDEVDWNSVVYSQPWLGVRITLEKIN